MLSTSRRRFRDILCPVDFSDDSRAALRYAAAIARRSGGHLTVMFVNDPLLVAAAAAAYDRRLLVETTESELRRFVVSGVGRSDAPAVDTLVVLGKPAHEIQKAAQRLGSDLVVLGTRGLGRSGKLFFGSTTERVLRHAEVPILVVPHTAGRRMAPTPSWPSRMLAAIELGSRAAADVRASCDVAQWFKTRLWLVTVVPPSQAPAWLRLRPGAHERARLADAREKLKTLAAPGGRKAASVRVLTGDPAAQISSVADDTAVGLIVLHLRPAVRLLGARQGSVTYRVLCRSAVPVLALTSAPRSAK